MVVASLGAFYNVKEAQAVNTQNIAVLRDTDSRHEAQLKDLKADVAGPLAELKADMKEFRLVMSDVRESVAILRGRSFRPTGSPL